MSGQIPYPSNLTPGKKSGILWREIRASSTDSLDMIGEKYYNERDENRTPDVESVISL